MIEFFMGMMPPTITAQEHKVSVVKGKPVFYDPPEVKDAKAKLTAHLAKHVPGKMFMRGVRLTVKWLFPKGKNNKNEEYADSHKIKKREYLRISAVYVADRRYFTRL